MADHHQYSLLESPGKVFGSEDFVQEPPHKSTRSVLCRSRVIFPILLLISFAGNIFLSMRLYHSSPEESLEPYSSLARDTLSTYRVATEYWGENETLSEELWEALDTSPIAVALSDEWAEEHGLPKATRFPWDDSKGMYFVKAFHQIHCLKIIRRVAHDLRDGAWSADSWEHFQHCLDTLRQDIICQGDDTPMQTTMDGKIGDGQVRQCRDWDKLIAWTQDPERNACYRQLSDYIPSVHSIEKYAFCPRDSPYYEVSEAYFEKWGHNDPFVA